MSTLADILAEKRIVVCCGAGGVGKTTTAAALSIGMARRGRRVLVLTIDPSRRLAQTLGVTANTPEPVPLGPEREREAGITGPGSVSAWVLDPRMVSDRTVRRLSRDPAEADRLLQNPIYGQVTRMIAGMQEYTAMEALHGFVESGTFDLVILDTPPSRNALNFLEAPQRLGEFLDGRIFKLMLPREEGRLLGTTRKVVDRVLAGVFGQDFYRDLQVFFGSFSAIFAKLNGNAARMRARLQADDATFLLVTTPIREAVDDALFFEQRIRQLELPLGGLILNRSLVGRAGLPMPGPDLLGDNPTALERQALSRLVELAAREVHAVEAQYKVAQQLVADSPGGAPTIAAPDLPGGAETLEGLAELGAHLLDGKG